MFQICFSPSLAGDDTKLAAFTVEGELFVFGREETADKACGASVKATGAGGNGFSVRCDLLHPQKMYKVREKVTYYNYGGWALFETFN